MKQIVMRLKAMAWGLQALSDDLLGLLETAEGDGRDAKDDDGRPDQDHGRAGGGLR